MFDFLKKKSAGEIITLKLGGMHCTSCAMNIDGALEETSGVIRSDTNYARSVVKIEFDPSKVSQTELVAVIEKQGYTISL